MLVLCLIASEFKSLLRSSHCPLILSTSRSFLKLEVSHCTVTCSSVGGPKLYAITSPMLDLGFELL